MLQDVLTQKERSTMKIYRMKELTRVVGLARATIYSKIKNGEFPKGTKLSCRARGWTEDSVTEWFEKCEQKDREVEVCRK